MNNRQLFIATFLLSAAAFPVAVSAQQPDAKPGENQAQSQTTPASPQISPVQPERTPQQSDQARQQDKGNAEDMRIKRDWTARERGDERVDSDRMRERRTDQDRDDRTVGRNWRLDNEERDRDSRHGSIDRDRDEGRYYETRPRRRVKTCIEYDNGDEFCRYMD